ncbi:MAG: hypothetical protein U5N55_08555 [Cypionkella sp.]|nr:hypothetical protein [Cypionkella sp.]
MLDTLNQPFVTAPARQGPERTPHRLPACAAQLGHSDGHGVPAHVHRHRHRLDLRRGDVPRPGLGPYFVSSIEMRDYPLEMALVLMITMMFCVAYLISDIVYALAQPAHPLRDRRPMSSMQPTAAPTRQRPALLCAWRRFARQQGRGGRRRDLWDHRADGDLCAAVHADGPSDQDYLTAGAGLPSAEYWFGVDDLGRDFFTRDRLWRAGVASIGFSAAAFSPC